MCNLFKIDDHTINYTALLLTLCKDEDPVVGFAKALELSLGRYICWQKNIGAAYVENVRQRRFLEAQAELERQLAHQEAIKRAESVLDFCADKAVHICESVIINDYVSEGGEKEESDSKLTETMESLEQESSSLSGKSSDKCKCFFNGFLDGAFATFVLI